MASRFAASGTVMTRGVAVRSDGVTSVSFITESVKTYAQSVNRRTLPGGSPPSASLPLATATLLAGLTRPSVCCLSSFTQLLPERLDVH